MGRYNRRLFSTIRQPTMEAERLNAITNQIADLRAREQELRRYL